MVGSLQADQSISFQLMSAEAAADDGHRAAPIRRSRTSSAIPASAAAAARRRSIPASVFVSLKPLSQRDASVDQVIARLRPKLAQVPGGRLVPAAGPGHPRRRPPEQRAISVHAAGRQRRRTSTTGRRSWSTALEHNPVLTDVNSDQQQRGLETDLVIDRDTASRLGITPAQIDNTLYDAFGQRQVSVIYSAINQYHVVMEIDPRYTQYPDVAARHLRGHVRRRRRPAPQTHRNCAGAAPSTAARVQRTSAPRRSAPASPPRADADVRGDRQQQFGAQRRHQRARQYRPRRDLDRRGGLAPPRRRWSRSPRSAITGPATRRYRSITRACSSPRPSRSICTPGESLGEASRRRSTPPSNGSTCRRRSTARSPAPRRLFQQSLGQRADPDRSPRSPPSTSCSACSTRATSTRSRSSRRCRRPASARCWR